MHRILNSCGLWLVSNFPLIWSFDKSRHTTVPYFAQIFKSHNLAVFQWIFAGYLEQKQTLKIGWDIVVVLWLFANSWSAAHKASLFFTISNSCPLSRWCHSTILSSVTPFSWPQFFPASESFPVCQLFQPGGQSIGVSASTSVLRMNTQDWFPLG